MKRLIFLLITLSYLVSCAQENDNRLNELKNENEYDTINRPENGEIDF